MRIPTRHLDLKEVGYEGYWVEAPRSVPRGFLADMSKYTVPNVPGRIRTPEETERAEHGELLIIDRITGWNLDDDEGRVLPLPRSIKPDQFEDDPKDQADGKTAEQKCHAARVAILAFIPVEIMAHLSSKFIAGDAMNQAVAGF